MCGILCSLNFKKIETKAGVNNDSIQLIEHTKTLLKNRGPDVNHKYLFECDDFVIEFCGFVLWQQGAKATIQPLVEKNQVLLFNGDIYSTSLEQKSSQQSDTDWLFCKILECHEESEFMELLKHIQGPYSLIYYNHSTKRLYFARDSLGRQTLLIGCYENSIQITSVASKQFGANVFMELPAIGIFCLNLNNDGSDLSLKPWQDISIHEHFTDQIHRLELLLNRKVILIQDQLKPYWMKIDDSQSVEYDFATLLNENIDGSHLEILTKLSYSKVIQKTCDKLLDLLEKSVKERVETTPGLCKNCIKSELRSRLNEHSSCPHPKIGILFSGGIDCSILAVLADKFIDKTIGIDLINVSFEKIIRSKLPSQENYNTPDRLTSQQTLQELIHLCPDRKWNLIEVNVTREELRNALKLRISDLCYPLNSVLDESLGSALWFAASGKGQLNGGIPYESPCRVLLIGSGADELFGGYTRHRNAFLRSGHSWISLDDELHLDWIRLPSRNLARDDRIIGDRSITARSPYVEENIALFVRNLKASQKCLHLLAEGIGDKLLLRLCAFRMGLREVCWLKKRALQFGSRVADRKQNAKDVSEALL